MTQLLVQAHDFRLMRGGPQTTFGVEGNSGQGRMGTRVLRQPEA